MENPLISIITTVRNGEKYLRYTLESVKQQSYRPIEHIIVDDGSSDNTISIINDFSKEISDYKVILFEPHLNQRGKALNFGVAKASGDWIAIIDADDVWIPQKLKLQYDVICLYDIDLLATTTSYIFYDREVNIRPEKEEKNTFINLEYVSFVDTLKKNNICHSSVLIRKSLCFYDESRYSQYDYELWLRMALQGHKMAILKNPLTIRRLHDSQSFEAKFGIIYRWRALSLIRYYLNMGKEHISSKTYILVSFKSWLKFIIASVIPRRIRLIRREKNHNKPT